MRLNRKIETELKFKKNKKLPKMVFEVRKGKKGDFDLYIFPGHQIGDMAFPAFCVLLKVQKRLKHGIVGNRAFVAVMN